MNEYTFPFNTCEKFNKTGIAQPYSSLFNLINCLIIFYFLLKYNCKKMLEYYPHFPYRIFIETIGIILFYIICNAFYRL